MNRLDIGRCHFLENVALIILVIGQKTFRVTFNDLYKLAAHETVFFTQIMKYWHHSRQQKLEFVLKDVFLTRMSSPCSWVVVGPVEEFVAICIPVGLSSELSS